MCPSIHPYHYIRVCLSAVGKAWEEKLEWNPKTFQDVYNMNTEADVLHLERKISSAHSRLWRNIVSQQSSSNINGGGGGGIERVSSVDTADASPRNQRDAPPPAFFPADKVLAVVRTLSVGTLSYDRYLFRPLTFRYFFLTHDCCLLIHLYPCNRKI